MKTKLNLFSTLLYAMLSLSVVFMFLESFQELQSYSKRTAISVFPTNNQQNTPKIQEKFKNLTPKPIHFEVKTNPDSKVLLVGDFNGWGAQEIPMSCDDSGVFSKTILLPQGTYRYYFDIDGERVLDEQAQPSRIRGESCSKVKVK